MTTKNVKINIERPQPGVTGRKKQMGAFLALIFGVACGIGGYFLIKSGTAANPNDWAQITPGILLVLICLVVVGVAVVEIN